MPEKLPLTAAELAWINQSLHLGDFLVLRTVEDLSAQLPSLELRAYPDGEEILREGETGDEMFVLYEGAVSVRRKRLLFGSKEVARLAPGAIFGEVGFLVQSPRSATVAAAGPAKAFRFGARDMQRILNENPRLAQALAALAGDRVRQLQK